jgi:hypothetical protein
MEAYADIRADLDKLSDAELRDYIVAMQDLEAFANAYKAVALAAVADRQSHLDDGAGDLAAWLQTLGHHHRGHALREVANAMALTELPTIWQKYAAGELCFDQVHELSKFATPDSDTHWAEQAPGRSAAWLRRCAAQHHKAAQATEHAVDDEDNVEDDTGPEDGGETLAAAHKPNALRFEHRPDGSGGRIIADYDTATLAMIEAAIRRQAESYGRDSDTGTWAPLAERCADALYDLVTAAKPSAWGDRATMVVHVPFDTLAGLDDHPGTLDMPFPATIAADLARDLAEAARLEVSLDNEHGNPIGIGHTSRNWPTHTYRRIHNRDGGTCRWPGCNNQIGLQVHHEPPWPEGPTDTHHGLLLCKRHHDFRTTKGFTITGNPESELHFWRPDGTEIPSARPPLPPQIRDHFR